MVGKNTRGTHGFVEEDIVSPGLEIFEVLDDLTLSRVAIQSNVPLAQRGGSNKENEDDNRAEPDRMQSILAKIGPDDEVKLFTHFFEETEKTENHITAACLGCGHTYKAQPNVHSNFVTHLKVQNFQCYICAFNWQVFSNLLLKSIFVIPA